MGTSGNRHDEPSVLARSPQAAHSDRGRARPETGVPSLSSRLMLAASAVLAAFLGLTGLTLDNAFRESARAAARDRLQAQVYLLLSAAEVDERGALRLPDKLPEARLSSPASGLFAEVLSESGERIWRSASSLSVDISYPPAAYIGEPAFVTTSTASGTPVFALSFGVIWEGESGPSHRYLLRVAESTESFTDQITKFRRSLWGWFTAAAVVLLVLQWLILRWGLAPLRRVAQEVSDVEAGRRDALGEEYPMELRRLTANLNALLAHARRQLQRYRNGLDDLAHSLKTPLAVLRVTGDGDASVEELRVTLREQVDRMQRTVDYQLQRAAASGRAPLSNPVDVVPVIDRLVGSMRKVYADKSIEFDRQIEAPARFRGDEADLTEVLGNLLDNACKWCDRRVAIEVRTVTRAGAAEPRLLVRIDDDGLGLAETDVVTLLQRGVRASSDRAGHGLGLAVVREIVEDLYRGKLELSNGPLGGARVQIVL